MFQDGSVKATLAKSITFLRLEIPSHCCYSGPQTSFCLPHGWASANRGSANFARPCPNALYPLGLLASIASFSTVSSLLTLFSKFFSPFLHSTCSLSVSRPYLALEEVYLPIWASIPRSSTLWKFASQFTFRRVRGFHPLCLDFPIKFCDRFIFCTPLEITTRCFTTTIFNVGFYLFSRPY